MRLPLLPPKALSEAQKPLYEDMTKGIRANFNAFKVIDPDGALMGPWNPWLRFPKYGAPVWELVKAMSEAPGLPRTVREVAILVTGAHFDSAYELYAHVAVAEAKGLSDDKIATIVGGSRPADLTHSEGVTYDVTHALLDGGPLPELLYRRAVETFGEAGAGELIYLVALYSHVSVILNGFNVPVPEKE
ncbi:carboxymuconolactone decarboxylase family protein [Xanthobacter sp. KR7-225]|uniref:carboxymuconolactone decarboxylase family protein n=1 Tax=Xanthobacter sp. KR7-225 TaxID=3156613 RepID=UPI0032B45858